jgi:hypothetical protein
VQVDVARRLPLAPVAFALADLDDPVRDVEVVDQRAAQLTVCCCMG